MQTVRVSVDNPDEVLAAFGANALIRVQSASAQAGPFTDLLSGPTQTVATKVYEYTFYDATGVSGTWYRYRFENQGGTVLGAYGVAFQPSVAGYCSLNSLKWLLGQDDTWVVSDAMLQMFIRQASAFIESKTKRQFYQDPVDGSTRSYSWDGWDPAVGGEVGFMGKVLLVPRGIVSLTTVSVQTYTGGPSNTIPSTDWFLRPTPQENDPGWPYTELWVTNIPASSDVTPAFYPGFATITLTGVFGWPAIPPAIEEVCQNLVIARYRGRGAGGGDSFKIAEDGTRTFERMLSAKDLKTLSLFSRKDPVIV